MPTYDVYFTENAVVYGVEAEDEDEAFEKAIAHPDRDLERETVRVDIYRTAD